jgi:hypothetical protein
MGRRALGKRKEMEEVDPRTAQAGSPIALFLFDLLADPSSTLRGLLRVSDLFCVRLTCKEAWRCIQHRPLTKLGVLRATKDRRGYGRRDGRGYAHHVPLLKWCLRHGVVDLDIRKECLVRVGEAGDVELVSEFLEVKPKTEEVITGLLCWAAGAGHDGLALQLWDDLVKLPEYERRSGWFAFKVAAGGCVRTAAAIDNDPAARVHHLSLAVRNGHQRFVEWVLADVEPDAGAQYIANAAKSGSLELVQWLYAKGYAVGDETLTNAAGSGNVDLCKWVVDHGVAPTQRAMEAAVDEGYVQVLEWLSTAGCRCTTEVLRHAVLRGGVSVVGRCLDHHPNPPDAGGLLALSCQNVHGTEVFEYLADQRGFLSSPTELMRAAEERQMWIDGAAFDAAILVKRYGIPLYPDYIWDAIRSEDLGRVRFAVSQGQQVSGNCYWELITMADPTFLNEVLLARKVGGSVPEADLTLIKEALCGFKCRPFVAKVLADHSIVV